MKNLGVHKNCHCVGFHLVCVFFLADKVHNKKIPKKELKILMYVANWQKLLSKLSKFKNIL